MWQITLSRPWLMIDFGRPLTVMGWTPQAGGKVVSQSLLWREVRNEDLTPDFDVLSWLSEETAQRGQAGVPCFLTSAQIADYAVAEAEVEGMHAAVLVTAGLGNAERIGQRREDPRPIGTINAALYLNQGLTDAAALEALSLMAEARTAAMIECAPGLWPAKVTGTGTDCLALCFDAQLPPLTYAGKHTALGEAIGRAALQAFSTAINRWLPPSFYGKTVSKAELAS